MDIAYIGRTVDLEFTGSPTTITYTAAQHTTDLATISSWGGFDGNKLASAVGNMLDDLWSADVIKFLDGNNRPIAYGSDGADDLNEFDTAVPLLNSYRSNGVVLVGGKGNDNLTGAGNDDLYGGDGNDILTSGIGSDS